MWSAVGALEMYWSKTEIMTKFEGIVMYPLHSVLLNVSADLQLKIHHNGHTLVGFLPVEYEGGSSGAGEF